MVPANNLDNYSDLREDESVRRNKKKEIWLKIFRIFLRIVRWPLIFIAIPMAAFFIPYLVSGRGQNIIIAMKDDTLFLWTLLCLVAGIIVAGIIGALIKKKFLYSTGIAALTYIVASFFIKKPSGSEEIFDQNVSFENSKLILVVVFILFVFIGDLIGLILRLLKALRDKRKEN